MMASACRAQRQARNAWQALIRAAQSEVGPGCNRPRLQSSGLLTRTYIGFQTALADIHLQPCNTLAASSSGRPSFAAGATGSLLPRTHQRHAKVLAAGLGAAAAPLLAAPHGWAVAFRRKYHTWYYQSKLRNRIIHSATSLDQLAAIIRQDAGRMDHINVAAFLRQLQLAGAAEAGAAASATSASSPAPSAALTQPSSSASPSAVAAAAVTRAAGRAVALQVAQLAGQATEVARLRAKWFDPRYAALVVSRMALLGHTDGRVLNLLTDRVLDRLDEAYSRDLLLLLRGLHAHMRLHPDPATRTGASTAAPLPSPTEAAAATASPAATTTTATAAPGKPTAAPAPAAASQSPRESVRRLSGGRCRPAPEWVSPRRLLPYRGPPVRLLAGVEAFLLGRIPTGQMPPESVDGLLRYSRALSGRPVGPELCATAVEDLRRRLPIYAPGPLAGLLSTLAAERHPLPPDLLDAAANQFAAHAATHGTGAAAARFLAAAAAALRNQQPPRLQAPGAGESTDASPAGSASGAAETGEQWISSRLEVLAECLNVMIRDLPGASPDQLRLWLQALAKMEAPLGVLAAAASTGAAGPSSASASSAPGGKAAAAAAAATFVRAHGAATERALPGMAPEAVARLRKVYDAVGLPYPRGL